jgi:hypothetical protein
MGSGLANGRRPIKGCNASPRGVSGRPCRGIGKRRKFLAVAVKICVAWMEPTGRANARPMINSAKSGDSRQSDAPVPDCAEPVIGRRLAPTRWLHPGYAAVSILTEKA